MEPFHYLKPPPPGIPEGRRIWIVRLFFISFLLLMFEGALRKWVWPEGHRYLFFIRDPFVLCIYLLGWRYTISRHQYVPLKVGFGLAFAAILLPLFHGTFHFDGIILSAYGWRNYFMMMPLPFILMDAVKKKDMDLFVKIALMLTIPMAFLVFEQSFRGERDPLNWGVNPEIGFNSLPVGRGMIRAAGTFTSVYGPVMMIGSSLALLLAMWIMPGHRRPVGMPFLLASTMGVITMVGVSGSRMAFVLAGIIVVIALGSSLFVLKRGISQKAFIFPLLFVIASGLVIPSFFPRQFEAIAERALSQTTEETGFLSYMEIILRPWDDIAGFFNALMNTPFLGYGLGTGGNAGLMMGVAVWAEGEWAKHLIDLGPLLGLGYVVFRFMMIWFVGRRAIEATKQTGDPLPLFLFFFMSVIFFNGHLTGQGTVNGFGWFFAGLALVATKTAFENEPAPP